MLQEIWWLQFKVKVIIPARNYCLQKQKAENRIPVLGTPGYPHLMCELWLELVQVQASFAPVMPLQVGTAAKVLPKLLTPLTISQAICFHLSTGREHG